VRKLARRAIFLIAAAFMLLAPSYNQVFGGDERVFPTWRMFHLRGAGTCTVRYYNHGLRVDRYKLAGLTREDAPADFRLVSSVQQARAHGREICELLGAAAEVRVELRCADLHGYHAVLDREDDLCK
jgi:hypothetical protein